MADVLIRMRLRLLANSFTGMQAMTLGLSLVAGLAVAALGMWPALANLGSARASADLLALLFALWALGWVMGPLFLGGAQSSLRPELFAALPVPSRRLARGLFAASLVGIGPVVTAAAFAAGVVYASRYSLGEVLLAVAAMTLQMLVVLLVSKVCTELTGATVTSTARAVVSALPWAVLAGLAAQSWLLLPMVSRLGELSPVASVVLRWLPSSWGLVSIEAAAAASWGLVAASLAGLAGLVLLLFRVWSQLVSRRLSSVVTVRPATAGHWSRSAGIRSGWLRLLPGSAVGAVAAKEVRTTTRDLNRALMFSFAICFALTVALIPLAAGRTEFLAAAGVIVAVLATTGAAQLYSSDGTALWQTLMVPGGEDDDVRGRQLGWLVLVTPIALSLTVVGGLLAGHAWLWPWTLALLPAALGGGAGVIVAVSVFAPIPMADPKKRDRSAAGGDGSTGLVAWAVLPLSLLTVVPAAVLPLLGLILDHALLSWLGVPVGVITGVVCWFVLGRLAGRRLARHGPELLSRLRSGPGATLIPSSARPQTAAGEKPDTPMPRGTGAIIWFLYLAGFVVLVPQSVVAGVLAAADVQASTWFLVLHLPERLQTAGAVAMAVIGALLLTTGWLLSRQHSKAARKQLGLP